MAHARRLGRVRAALRPSDGAKSHVALRTEGEFHLLRFLSDAKLLHFGAFERRFEPPERPVLLSTPGNSDTPDPMRSVAFVASPDYVMIGVDSMASDHFFGDRGAFDAATRDARRARTGRCAANRGRGGC